MEEAKRIVESTLKFRNTRRLSSAAVSCFDILHAEILLSEEQYQEAQLLLFGTLQKRGLPPVFQYYGHSIYGELCLWSGQMEEAKKHLHSAAYTLQLMGMSLKVNAWYLPRVCERLESFYAMAGDEQLEKKWAKKATDFRESLKMVRSDFETLLNLH